MTTSTSGTAPAYGIADPDGFGWGVFHERHPALVRRLCESNPYTPEQRARLDALLEESRSGTVRSPAPETAAHVPWAARGHRYVGRPWHEAPFLWAESYFYLRLLECVDHFVPGPWQGVDPFAPMKAAELADPGLEAETAWRDGLADASPAETFHALILAALYGNRADLGFQLVQATTDATDLPLLADDTAALWRHIGERPPGDVHMILDNAGRELLADLLLADHLLATGRADAVVLHVKPLPYYVSDATAADVRDCLLRIAAFSGAAGKAARRLREAAAGGRLRLATHEFYCSPSTFDEMPADLRAALAAAGLLVFKGDLNYRRLVGDRAWPATRPFADAVSGVPSSLVALRTLKSDVVVGLDAETAKELDATGTDWRTDGTRALVQARLRP
ncbi:ARMT1-like domain-containing protein [Streptomyces sp. I05A-00742]|uniref:ARMT1-like domain-containing protein n=1 Tax=Streptomyces sp. I05A-00742 TaxID=2732853 RepID=UPI0014886935|nr:ARMT1-like domain-containing protein [Streptomyces sp. I05A-00742]